MFKTAAVVAMAAIAMITAMAGLAVGVVVSVVVAAAVVVVAAGAAEGAEATPSTQLNNSPYGDSHLYSSSGGGDGGKG